MVNNQNKNQNQESAEAADWQPDQAIIFDKPDQPEEVSPAVKLTQPAKATQSSEEGCFLNDQQSASLRSLANQLEATIGELKRTLQVLDVNPKPAVKRNQTTESVAGEADANGAAIEGYFDGEKMISATGKTYAVPANYASKSKLVEGDTLKLVIGNRGNFIYKQIAPIERQRLVARLEQAPDGNYYAVSEHQRWCLIKASVSYFRAQPGDQIAILIPRDMPSNFAALENLVAE